MQDPTEKDIREYLNVHTTRHDLSRLLGDALENLFERYAMKPGQWHTEDEIDLQQETRDWDSRKENDSTC